ncbi:MAG TPA: RNA polymerase sigma factor [Gaiellaceae bacterium]
MRSQSESVLARRYREVYRFVRRQTVSARDAEDLTQEVFAEAARALGPLSVEAPPTLAWLYTVARRRLIDATRRDRRRAGRSAETVLELVPSAPSEYGPTVARVLVEAIAALPDPQREVVVRKVLQGQTFAEIATRLNATEAACKMRFARGLEAVRAELTRKGVEP